MFNLLTVIGVGFLLGIRHATDPDHVIAVTTIVSRQRSIRHAGLIGILWGLGHTITILLVGAAIILYNVVIPPRMGLSMELAVGLMLVFLGVMNLTGSRRGMTLAGFYIRIPTGMARAYTPIFMATAQRRTFTWTRSRKVVSRQRSSESGCIRFFAPWPSESCTAWQDRPRSLCWF
jgi:ABC-type nickel/cobalt efflux system permease component RcnA